MRGFILGLSVSVAFIVGCVAGSSRLFVPPASAQQRAAGVPRWEYYCTGIRHESEDVMQAANRLGAQYWEMAGVGAATAAHPAVWCFKRPLP